MMEKTHNDEKLLWQMIDTALSDSNLREVVLLMQKLAGLGVWRALARIGEIYELGVVGVEIDTEEAVNWYRRAIFECDDPMAHLGLGRIYFSGRDSIQQDFSKSYIHLMKAYSHGLVEAGIFLGIMAMHGHAMELNWNVAEDFFINATKGRFPIAYRYLAYMAGCSGKPYLRIWYILREFFSSSRLRISDRNHPNLWKIPD
ncbi:tetratricopeptide repeat protein [Duganella aceris]|uniref:Sel1 repeat family protein n=1 Tax=Duganella aceris TaxID=2703883 RepID=A0ABX0FJK0_9BURK|nr:tetratricopeptide repeat protein [Duganella aceris]NGZ84744.1 sel1 repeat family protein [Duganella aceris]